MPTPGTDVRRSRGRLTAQGAVAGVLCGVALGANAEVSITPRFATYFDNTSQRQSAVDYNTPEQQAYLDILAAQVQQINALAGVLGIGPATLTSDRADSAQRGEQVAFPQFGATVTFGWRDSETTQIALTALYGTASTSASQIATQYHHFSAFGENVLDADVRTTNTTADLKRLDLEATVQHRLNETFSLIGGVRAERTAYDMQTTSTGMQTYNFVNLYYKNLNIFQVNNGLPPTNQPVYPLDFGPTQWQQSLGVWTYSARFGAAAYAPVGDKHLFYVNGLVHVSNAPSISFTRRFANGATQRVSLPSETFLGPDISVGYMYRISDRFGVDLRYRATVYFPVAGPSEFKDARVNHGIGLGFTTWLGGR